MTMNHHRFRRPPPSLLLFFLFLFLFLSAGATALPPDLISLLSLKSSLKDPLNALHDWEPDLSLSKPGTPPVWCSWSGIKCDPKTHQVVSLDISNRTLSGEVPAEIKYLRNLRCLNISRNEFAGAFPTAVFRLTSLRVLDINHNLFNSAFPPGVAKLKRLRFFDAFNNGFVGSLPAEFARLEFLEHLNLGGSEFEGEIPKDYGGFQRLKYLYLAGNHLGGRIPAELGLVTSLQHLEIGYNNFSGGFPVQFASLFNLSFLDISHANLSGEFPIGITNLTKLETLLIYGNNLYGGIPASIGKLQSVEILDLSDNNFSGSIPEEITSVKNLEELSLMNNKLTGNIPRGIEELSRLKYLFLWNNSLNGILPQKLGLNSRLQRLDVSSNDLSGPVPPNLCFGNNLEKLILFSNKFSGELPPSLANCTPLYRFRVQNNRLNGSIPIGFGSLPNITFMDMSKNNFTGKIPADLAKSASLMYLDVSENSFQGPLPENIWTAPSLQHFSASFNNLTGEIPKFQGCENFNRIEIEGNELSGTIPWDIDHCVKLVSLNLRHNSLTGIIPWEISKLPSISLIDLSHNFLNGTIPSAFGNCNTIEAFNVSYNLLTGSVPSSGTAFSSLHPSSFIGNNGLCGAAVHKPCVTGNEAEAKPRPRQLKNATGTILWITAAAVAICLFILLAGFLCFRPNYHRRLRPEEPATTGPWKLTAFQRLNFTADDVAECLSATGKIVGAGSAGTVYKTVMPGGEVVAVKKLRGTIRRSREVEVLGNVKHRNIVRLLGWCSDRESTMLLYEYMPNGSLDDLLHGRGKKDNLGLDWTTRYKIALGVAQGICYLHHDCDPVVVHRDLKPSNILLDGEMEARVADFGVAKLIHCRESMSAIAGSFGYIAPEYAYTLQVDEKSDIYSYGVVLMEIISGKRSVDSEFGEGNGIVDWVRLKTKNKEGLKELLDQNIHAPSSLVKARMMLLLKVALMCTCLNPADRPSMRDVISMLEEGKPKTNSLEISGDGGGMVVKDGVSPEKKFTVEY